MSYGSWCQALGARTAWSCVVVQANAVNSAAIAIPAQDARRTAAGSSFPLIDTSVELVRDTIVRDA
ncbi:hypothetical protein Athai_14430 [Actinocatenispora thailandica]|uniref:Uncharacterized protein n=1 Tax=Actinocatenispora thailandica TaxID=227318 RepID=A0A7R7DLJ8_9ACTN|nr:hypothetical protein Athai_14430 [Actinocatenispora thailandica]